MIIAISVGSCYNLKLNYNEAIMFIKNYKINGIELLFEKPKDLLEFKFKKKSLDFVQTLEFISIHMPFHEIEYNNNLTTKKVIRQASILSKKINPSYFVFHPNTIKDYSVLDWNKQNCVENLNSKEYNKGFQTVQEIKKVLEENTGLGLVLDTCHMLESGIEPKEFLELKKYVKGIHLAVQWKQGEKTRTHGFLQENPRQLEQIKPLLKLKVPKIIEVDTYPEKISLIEKEIELINKMS